MNTSVPSIFAKNRGVSRDAVADLGPGMHPRISIQGSRFTLIDAGGAKAPWNGFQLPVIVIGANPKKSKVYYDGPFDPTNPGPPTCYSDNGVAPSINASRKMARTCGECRLGGWGSAQSSLTGKDTKACQDKKKIAVRVIGDPNRLVYELQVPPASLKIFTQYAMDVEKHTTPDNSRKADISDVVTVIYFKQEAVGILQFHQLGWISNLDAADGWHPSGSPDGGLAIAQEIDQIVEGNIIDDLIGLNDKPFGGVWEGEILPPTAESGQLPAPAQTWQGPSTGAFAGPHPLTGPQGRPMPEQGPMHASLEPQSVQQPQEKRKPGRPPKTVAPAPKEALADVPWGPRPATASPVPSASPFPPVTPIAPNGPKAFQAASLPPATMTDAIQAAINLRPRD